jgi:hypothetical protein
MDPIGSQGGRDTAGCRTSNAVSLRLGELGGLVVATARPAQRARKALAASTAGVIDGWTGPPGQTGCRIASRSCTWRRTPPQTWSQSSNTLGSLIE